MDSLRHRVQKISKDDAHYFLKKHHYLGTLGKYALTYGLYDGMLAAQGKFYDALIGVCCVGQAPHPVQRYGFSSPIQVLEITRFALVPEHDPNAGSWFLRRVLHELTGPVAIVAYADPAQNHIGYLYQAANFAYYGQSTSKNRMFRVGSKLVHERSLGNQGIYNALRWANENGIEIVEQAPKHRYFYFKGTRQERAWFKEHIRYNTAPYPKLQGL
jgi:hypothetical protein